MLTNIGDADYSLITHDVDAYEDHADDLMDDLFGDVEHILSVNAQAKLARVKSAPKTIRRDAELDTSQGELVTTNALSLTKIDLPAMSLPPVSEQEIMWIEPYMARETAYVANKARLTRDQDQANQASRFWDRLLLGTACGSVLLSVLVWATVYGFPGSTRRMFAQSIVNPAQVPQVTPEIAKFTDEVRRSLASVNTQTSSQSSSVASQPNQVLPNGQILPPIVGTSGTNIQSIYIPVFQPPAAGVVGLGTNPGAIPSLAAPTTAMPVAAAPVAVTPGSSYTLSGVLDLGDRSSVLVNIDGSVQAIKVGAPISNSGWVLSRVNRQEATIRRGNETKSLVVGQKF